MSKLLNKHESCVQTKALLNRSTGYKKNCSVNMNYMCIQKLYYKYI